MCWPRNSVLRSWTWEWLRRLGLRYYHRLGWMEANRWRLWWVFVRFRADMVWRWSFKGLGFNLVGSSKWGNAAITKGNCLTVVETALAPVSISSSANRLSKLTDGASGVGLSPAFPSPSGFLAGRWVRIYLENMVCVN